MIPYKFTNTARTSPYEDKYHALLIRINSHNDILALSTDDLKDLYFILQYQGSGIYKSAGWAYDMRPYLKRYWFEVNTDESDSWSNFPAIHEAYAIDEKDLRKRYCNIIEINEVPNKIKPK